MNKQEHLLACLGEECGEIQEMIGKSLRFGIEDFHPITKETNIDRIILEIIDLITITEMLIKEKILPDFLNDKEALEKAKLRKRERVEKYMQYAQEKGVLNGK